MLEKGFLLAMKLFFLSVIIFFRRVCEICGLIIVYMSTNLKQSLAYTFKVFRFAFEYFGES